MTTPLRVAVLGAGTVGHEVVAGLLERPGALAAASNGVPLQLAGIAVRDVEAAAARGLPAGLLTDAPAHLVASPDTDVVVELMGGEEPARTLVGAALGAGKAVVTANKQIVAGHGAELEATARRTGAAFRFEAAVAGGIPVLGPLAAELGTNRVERVRGIVNGTTNFILTAMAEGHGTYEGVLRDAQARGYAEADPSGDVEGRDPVNKLVILARLAWDVWVDPAAVPTRPAALQGTGGPGITGVTSDELAGAAALGLTIRLLATATRHPGPAGDGADGAPALSVVPAAVPLDSPLGRTGGVRNRVEIRGEPVGDVGFDGPGAGGPATSSAVLGDLAAIARGAGSTWAGRPAAPGAPRSDAPAPAPTCRWFAFLPGARRRRALTALAEATAELPSGLAVRTDWADAETVVSRIRAASPSASHATLYSIDD